MMKHRGGNIGELRSRVCSREFCLTFGGGEAFQIVAHRIISLPLARSSTFGLDPYPFFPLFSNIRAHFFGMIERPLFDGVFRY